MAFRTDNGSEEQYINPAQLSNHDGNLYTNSNWTPPLLPPPPRPRELRPLTVNEALQYSPLTSIVPLDTSIISYPSADISTSYPLLSDSAQRDVAHQQLKSLDKNVVECNGQSKASDSTLETLRSLLKDSGSTYVFKKSHGRKASSHTDKDVPRVDLSKRLGPFATRLFHASDVPFRYASPEKSEKTIEKSRLQRAQSAAATSKFTTPRQIQENRAAYSHNAHLTSQPERTIAPQQLETVTLHELESISPRTSAKTISPPQVQVQVTGDTIAPSKLQKQVSNNNVAPPEVQAPASKHNFTLPKVQVQVQVPTLPKSISSREEHISPAKSAVIEAPTAETTSELTKEEDSEPTWLRLQPTIQLPVPQIDPSKYQVYTEPPEKASNLVKRKLDRLDEVQTSDQRALSDEALQTLHDHVSDILDAEESLEAHEMHDSESYFITIQGENGASLTLAPAVQVKLETQLQKVISLGRFKDVPVENLLRIHKLCENALIHAESIDIAIQPGWSDDDTTSWLEHMETVENASRSARTALRIMTGGRTEKQIYSEELLQRVIGLLCKMTDTCLVPMVEARSTDGDLAVFQLTSSNKKTMSQFMHHASKLMSLLLDLLAKEELAESAVTSVEFFVIRLLFVENAQAEKDSVLGIHKFETFRRSAMNIIAAIFSRYPDQRHFIISEVLTSLQKLPTQKARARQYKLGDGKRLQLVSVLLIRLVQTSGTRTLSSNSGSKRQPTALGEDVDAESAAGSITSDVERKEKSDFEDGSEDEHHSMTNDGAAIPRRLIDNAKKLYESAGSSAQHIVKFLVHRASSSTKTGDEPHRPLLDMFVEDLVTVFSLPDWPAAELLLRALVTNMVEILNDQKRPVPAKNMALEVLGMMATAILDVSASARHMAKGIENADTSLSDQLAQYIEDHEDGQVELAEMTSWKGPFRIVMQYLIENSSDAQSLSAQGYFTTQWTKLVIWGNGSANEKPKNDVLGDSQRGVGLKLCKTLYVGKWSITEEFDAVSYTQCRLAYLLTLLNVGFCRALPHITNALVAACSSDQARIKTRSLKSVTQMVEKEPLLLDRLPQVKNLMFRCITDASSQVRDNTLALISQCITAKPGLENQFLKPILMCADDSSPSLRRRSIRVMKDIYLRHNFNDSPASKDIRAIVSETMLKLVDDLDEGTRELTRQTFEEIWLGPYWKACRTGELSVHDKVAIKGQLSLMVHTVQRGERVSSIFEAFLKYAFSEKSKQKSLNQKVSSALVAAGFEGVIDPSEVPGQPEQRSILQCMAVFARAEPTLFSQQQVACLQPYIIELKSTDDLDLFRESVIILRCVLPTLPTVQKDFLKKIQDDLIKNITKLAKAELNEVAICLWTINGVLQNIERLVTVVTSVLKRLQTLQDVKFTHDGQVEVKQTQRLVLLAGHFGRHCNFESQLDRFTASISRLKAPFVATRIVDAIKPFATKAQPPTLRATALESIGMVCQAWPRNYTLPEVIRAFQEVLRGPDHNLQQIVLASFRDFFATQDQQFTIIALSGERDPLRGGKIGGSMTASDNDGAAALIAQGFLGDILRIAMSSLEEFALTATEVMASITRQGLVHPKECGPALVALETSTNERIAEVALQQHQNLHQQHESMFEREYIRAIFEAYKYQRDIVKETRGYIRRDGQLRAKLHSMYEVVKTSKSKYQAKFIAGYCSKINFDFAKEESVNQLEQHLDYARFLIENMAFFDFGRADDVAYAISCMESIVANTGAGLAHAINTEVFKVTLDPETGAPANVPDDAGNSAFDISDEKLNRLTLASVILSMLWAARSYVRHLYGISSKDKSKDAKGKATKDIKAITKNNAVTGDKFVESIERISHALDSRDTALTQCRSFAELLSIDSEVQVTAEGENDEDGAVRMQTPSGDEDDRMTPASGGRKLVKRKSSMSLLDSPMKKRRGRPPGSRNKNRSTDRKSMDRDEESD